MSRFTVAVASILCFFIASPALAQVVITQAKAAAGNVTPGDTAGYPITISQPGAYRLESNLTVPSGAYGIYIIANNVDLDMNGFTLTGNGTGTWGVISNSGESRIHDGVINRFRYSGVYLRGNIWTIEDMTIVRNGTMGIDATGVRNIRVQQSLIAYNVGNGAVVGDDAEIVQNIVSENQLSGVICGGSCHVEGNKIGKNLRTGISIDSGLVISNTINENGTISPSVGPGYYGIYGTNPQRFRVGIINNALIDNCPALGRQALFVDVFGPNSCIGSPCT